jgi:arginase
VSFGVVEVPAMAGDASHPAAEGPAALSAALAASGCEPRAVLRPGDPSPADAGPAAPEAPIELYSAVAACVREAVARTGMPLVLAGSCDVAPAVLAGIRDPDVGVVWIDAHADFNTPESSASGFWPGMTLAVVVGDCGDEVRAAVGGTPVAQERVALVGVRNVSPDAEAERLRNSALRIVPWLDGAPQASVEAALDSLREHLQRVYVHLDLDALDPAAGEGVVDPPVPGGLSHAQLLELLTTVRERFEIAGATIATYTPASDDGRTLAVAVSAARLLVD